MTINQSQQEPEVNMFVHDVMKNSGLANDQEYSGCKGTESIVISVSVCLFVSLSVRLLIL